jgi:peroxin-11B
MRIGKNVEHFKAAAVAADNKSLDPVLKYLAIGRQLGYGTYLTLDGLAYLDASGIKPSPRLKALGQDAYRAWMTGLVCNVISGVYTLYKVGQRAQTLNTKEGEDAVELKKLER